MAATWCFYGYFILNLKRRLKRLFGGGGGKVVKMWEIGISKGSGEGKDMDSNYGEEGQKREVVVVLWIGIWQEHYLFFCSRSVWVLIDGRRVWGSFYDGTFGGMISYQSPFPDST